MFKNLGLEGTIMTIILDEATAVSLQKATVFHNVNRNGIESPVQWKFKLPLCEAMKMSSRRIIY